jgi:hypothetical protein
LAELAMDSQLKINIQNFAAIGNTYD